MASEAKNAGYVAKGYNISGKGKYVAAQVARSGKRNSQNVAAAQRTRFTGPSFNVTKRGG